MGFPTVQCSICHKEVSKRSTVLLEPVTGKGGRGCRIHPEVARALDDMDMARMLKFRESTMEWERDVRAAALAIRTLNLVFRLPMDRATVRMREMLGVPKAIVTEARKRVEAMSPKPSPEEKMSLAMATIALATSI